MKEITEIVCEFYNVWPKAILTKNRSRKNVKARQVAMFIIKETGNDLSLAEIGAMFNRNHATVLHSLKTLKNDISTDVNFRYEVFSLLAKVQGENIEVDRVQKYCHRCPFRNILEKKTETSPEGL